MNFKKTKVAVASGLMAASMVLAPLAVYADEEVKLLDSASIVKTVNVLDDVTIKGNVTFQLEQIDEPSEKMNGVTAPNKSGQAFARIYGIKNGETELSYANGKYTVTADTDGKNNASDKTQEHPEDDTTYITEVGLDFSGAHVEGRKALENGLYTFKLTEIKTEGVKYQKEGTSDVNFKYGWSDVDHTEYVLRVYVKQNGKSVKYTIAKKNEDNTVKVDNATFTDDYTARANSKKDNGDPEIDSSLVINKEVADKTYLVAGTKFEFEIEFTGVGKLAEVPATIEAKIYKGDVAVERPALEKVDGKTNTYRFKLEDGEEIHFVDLPAGVKYKVTESTFANDGGTTNVATANNINMGSSNTKEREEKLGEHVNSALFNNSLKTITITGVVTHSAPFVIMVGALFVAVGGYVVLKKRIEE